MRVPTRFEQAEVECQVQLVGPRIQRQLAVLGYPYLADRHSVAGIAVDDGPETTQVFVYAGLVPAQIADDAVGG
jgi:hypothetical protein